MSKTKEVFNAFFEILSVLEINTSVVTTVKKTNMDHVSQEEYPCLEVLIGQDIRSEHTKQAYEHELTIYVDIHVNGYNQDIDDSMLDVRALVEDIIHDNQTLNLDYAYRTIFKGQSEPSYNGEGVDYASSTRLEFSVIYDIPH